MGLFAIFRRSSSPGALLNKALGDFELPSFSAPAMETLRMLRLPDVSSRALAQSIERSPALLVKVLRTVNSAVYGLRSRIASAERAVVLLGRSELESIVVSVCVADCLP